jgi:two-component sensor histidine kinase
MSIAALQRQLSMSNSGRVDLLSYFTQLCQSLGASMIADPARHSLRVSVDDSAVEADISVSLGLIVTELVINAIKHAFPDERSGIITVGYRSSGSDWTLSVTDNGIGMAGGSNAPKGGLGSGIVEALAKSLRGGIQLSDAGPGTMVTISHQESAGLQPYLPSAA